MDFAWFFANQRAPASSREHFNGRRTPTRHAECAKWDVSGTRVGILVGSLPIVGLLNETHVRPDDAPAYCYADALWTIARR